MIAAISRSLIKFKTVQNSLLVSVALSVFLLGHTTVFGGCEKDVDCKGDRICVDGVCTDPNKTDSETSVIPMTTEPSGTTEIKVIRTTPESEIVEEDKVEPEEKPEKKKAPEVIPEPGFWAVWINPLGFLQYGPTAGIEFRIVPNLYIGAHARYATMGFLYNQLLESRADEENYSISSIEVDPGSYGVGLEFKYYVPFPSRPNMLYFGMFGEYIQGGYIAFEEIWRSSNREQEEIYSTTHQSMGMGITLGHRWRFGETRKVLFTAGLITGVARAFSSIKEMHATEQESELPHQNEFILMAEMGIGYGM